MTSYSVILQRFNNEFRNGTTFSTNPTTDFSVDLKGNVGELIKLTQTIQISVTVNPNSTKTIQYNATADATYGELVGTGINYLSEGMYVGATVDVIFNGGAPMAATVGLITGTSNTVLRITKASITIPDGTVSTGIVIKMTSVPDTLIYKYGLNKNDFTGTSYTSWFDSNIQAYYISNLSGSLQTMTRVGLGIKSWDLSTVQAKFDATVSTYFQQYTVEHTFRIPYYVQGEYENINDNTSPDRFLGTASVRYDNGWFFGGTTLGEYIKAEIKGGPGNVGYFYESYNGYLNNYAIQNVSVSNSDNSGVIEGSVSNTVTFQVKKNSAGNFTTSSKVILYHSKLPTQSEYQNKTTVFSDIWLFDYLVTTESAGAVSSTIITNFNVTLNADPTILDVTCDIAYTTDQQLLITDATDYLLWVTVGYDTGALNPDDRVTLPVDLNQFSKNLDVTGLVSSCDVWFFEPFEFYTGIRDIANWTGFNGDLGGTLTEFTRNTTPENSLTKVQFRIISTDGTDEIDLLTINVPIGKIIQTNVGGEIYQILNTNTLNNFTLPTNSLLNRIVGNTTVPSSPTGTQTYEFRLGFQTPWRDWLFNNSVPYSLYDVSEPQNNQNYKTSNYSNNADGFEVFAVWEFTLTTIDGVNTIYRKETPESNITDFDTNGTAGFSGNIKLLDVNGFESDDIHANQNMLVIAEFPHSLGTIILSRIEGYIWIEKYPSTNPPWFLHTSLDFTKEGHPFTPSDTLSSGNTQFVEKISANNLVTLRCYTNRDNLQKGANYRIYARIKNSASL